MIHPLDRGSEGLEDETERAVETCK